MRCFRVFLHIARHRGVAPAADSHIKRRPRLARIGQAGRKPDAFDKVLGLRDSFDARGIFTTPACVAVLFNFRRKDAGSMASHSLALGCPLCASAYDKPNFSDATW